MKYLVDAIVVLIASVATAAPVINSVEGTVAQGDTLIILGTGFGTKSPATPMLWDDFEGGTNGQAIGAPVYGAFTRTSPSVYSTTTPYSGDICAHSALVGAEQGGAMGLITDWIPDHATNSFASMKFRLVGNITPSNFKTLRLNTGDPYQPYGEPNYNLGKQRTATNWYADVNNQSQQQVSTTGWPALPGQGDADCPWYSVSMWDHMGTIGVENGFVGREINGVAVEDRDIITRINGGGGQTHSGTRAATFFPYMSWEGYVIDLYIDDVYADTTFSRVYLQLDDVSADMQIPFFWKATGDTIKVVVNTGVLVDESTADLYVVDASGVVSPGYEVTISSVYEGEDNTAPGTPTITPGPPMTATWTAAVPTPTGYQFDWSAGGATRGVYRCSANSTTNIIVPEGEITGYVSAIDDGSRVSSSGIGSGGN